MIAPLLALVGTALAIPREDALDNASKFAAHSWTMTSANTHADCDSSYESDYSPGTYVGLPYDWGGYMSIPEYDSQLEQGYGAGSHSSDGVLSCTAGLDCSGFLSMDWESSHQTTSSLDAIATAISWNDIERADAVNDAGSHVVMFTHVGEDEWPVFWEASGGADKVHINSTGGWSYLDGYQPMRYDDIQDGSSTGTASSPRLISAFPYTDYWWTPGAASDVLDGYSCAPSTDEGGPEVLYKMTLATGGTLTAVVSDSDETDIDLHVLTAPSASTCLDRDDVSVSVHVDAGDVWLSLDSYVGSHEYSGAYALTVDFVPDEGGQDTAVDTGEPVDTGVPADTGVPGDTDEDPPAPLETEFIAPGLATSTGEIGGCGCASQTGPASGLLILGAALAIGRRRR